MTIMDTNAAAETRYSDAESVHGSVVEDTTGTPLGAVVVRWMAPCTAASAVELGRAVTATDGSFAVSLAATAEAAEALCLSKHRPQSETYLLTEDVLDGEHGGRVVVLDARETLVRVGQGTEPPDPESWRMLVDYLMANRLLRAGDLARELSAPSLDSPTHGWPAATRAAGLRAVGAAIQDKAAAQTLLDQGHFLDFGALVEADLGKAVRKFRGGLLVQDRLDRGVGIGGWLRIRQSDTELYRDYLRGVWVTAAQQMHQAKAAAAVGTIGLPPPPADVLERQLNGRFHQDFRTSDDAPKPAAKLVIAILRAALVTGRDRDGFGVAPASLPAQAAQTDDQYVAALIGATGVKPAELRNRFRVEFDRSPGTEASPIDLNVEALLGLLSDTWQSPEESFVAEPPVAEGLPLIFAPYIGRAAFHLQYEEWLERQRRFYPENIYDIRRNLARFHESFRKRIEVVQADTNAPQGGELDYVKSAADRSHSAKWLVNVVAIVDLARAALGSADLLDYPKAKAQLDEVEERIKTAFHDADNPWFVHTFDYWLDYKSSWNDDRWVSLKHRATRKVGNPAELATFEGWFDPPLIPITSGETGPGARETYELDRKSLARARTLYIWWLYYALHVLVPYLRSQLLVATSDHAGALRVLGRLTGYAVGVAETTTGSGYQPVENTPQPDLFTQTTLPYTTAVGFDDERNYDDLKPRFGDSPGPLVFTHQAIAMAPFEQRFFKLAQGEVMLDWADELYRNDDPSSIRRARELFKGVLFMHGADPAIAPHFASHGPHELAPKLPLVTGLEYLEENPARTSQLHRARFGFWQIEHGLNVYGFRADMVPTLRYKTLKQAADLFATSAKSAQTDFLGYVTRFEQARIEGWQTNSMVKKAEASAGIAAEQTQIAQAGVARAEEQVAQVNAQIGAKQKEIADADSFFGQAKDFFGGMKDSLSGLAKDFAASSGEGGVASSSAGGFGGSSGGGEATLGGAGILAGYAAFAYYGYTTMTGMADAANRRTGELSALRTVTLPAAQAQVRLKQRDVTIANFQRDIAAADLDLARTLRRFQQDRFLNVDLWNKLASFAQRLMRRYSELGARAAWHAERALAFQENREINIIRLNYFPTATRGVTGADRLLLDLAELEANRLQGIRLTAPVKHTISLARDFPLQFGQLKKTGRTTFYTDEARLRTAYPGTFAYRIRALTVAAQDAEGPAPRGMLQNLGVSAVSQADGSAFHILTRFPDALPLSEFRLAEDLFVYGLPGETLLQFEGSGFETNWEINLPLAANPKGLTTLADMLVTFDMNVSYARPPAPAPVGPVAIAQSVVVSALAFDPQGLASLRAAGGPAHVHFDLKKVALRAQEKNRKIANIAVMLLGSTEKTFSAKLTASLSVTQAAFQIVDGYDLSNGGALLGTSPARPLNAFVDLPVDQVFTLEIDRSGVVEELKSLLDIVLYVDYRAEL